MVIWALVGNDPGLDSTDRMTGFVEGRGTWQFRMLLAFADYGLNSIDHEEFDAEGFTRDPEAAIRKQVQEEEAVLGIINETNMVAEKEAVLKCLASPLIRFIDSAPSFIDLQSEIDQQKLLLVNVNLKVLRGEVGREGHMLILERIGEESVVVHDPGPRGSLGVEIPRKLFEEAWTSPSKGMANYIAVWRAPI